jgi:hypothetical protein
MDRDRWASLARQAEQQYGLLTRRQLLAGLTRNEFERRASAGLLQPAVRGVWLVAGAPRCWRQGVMAHCLAVGPLVAASRRTASRLWGFDAIADDGQVHLSVPRTRSGRATAGAAVHRSHLVPEEIALRFGIPTTTPMRTLADLAPLVSTYVLSRCTDEALRRRLITPSDLELTRVTSFGHKGAPALEAVTGPRVDGVGDSEWEDRVFRWLVAAGLPPPVRQHPVDLPNGLALLDMAYPHDRVGIEFDGWTWHRGRGQFDRDRTRASELALAGWTIVWVTSAHQEDEVVGRVRRALRAAAS